MSFNLWTRSLMTAYRLHSPQAWQRMNPFRIGRIEGQWKNFLPPIQGGLFRPLDAYSEAEEDQCAEPSSGSSTERSASPSPLFDAVAESRMPSKRRRKAYCSNADAASSSTSVSSMELDELGSEHVPSPSDSRIKQGLEHDLAKYPPLDPSSQNDIIKKYRNLNERIKTEGLYQCKYKAYMIECCRYAFLFAMCMLFLKLGWYGTSGIFLGMFWHQLVFTAHDAGHMGITHDFTTDTVIGILVTDYLGGLSMGWWKRNHNVHHIVTNSPEHDPDIEHMPFFAISHRFFESLRSTYYDRIMTYDAAAKLMIRYQHYFYYPILTFGRFNLYRLSWEYLILGLGPRKGIAWWHRWFEIAGQVFFWSWFGYGILYKAIPTLWGRFAFLMVSHMVTAPLHVQITLSHFAMSTADLGVDESFPQKMLRTTMDVDCPEWLDWFHGGLQFQAVHHLFPRIPRHNLRKTQKLVQAFCEDVGIPYAIYSFVDGNKEVISRLGDIGRQAAIFAECQKTVAAKPLDSH